MRHRWFILFILFECLVLLSLIAFSYVSVMSRAGEVADMGLIVRKLMLTDMAMWTAARYTRHPSQADLFTPFQDFPGSVEHFPAGSIITPPDHIRDMGGRTDDKAC